MGIKQPEPFEVLPVMWARALRSRDAKQPPCDTPGCAIKRAFFTLEFYLDIDYILQHLSDDPMKVFQHVLNEYAGHGGRPHCYKVINICYSCLCTRVEGHTKKADAEPVVNCLREFQGSESSLLMYSRYLAKGSPGLVAFCQYPDIVGCVREVSQ